MRYDALLARVRGLGEYSGRAGGGLAGFGSGVRAGFARRYWSAAP